jgi:hypothetical protein
MRGEDRRDGAGHLVLDREHVLELAVVALGPAALSDAELSRRGVSRATLARDVRAACDRGFEP